MSILFFLASLTCLHTLCYAAKSTQAWHRQGTSYDIFMNNHKIGAVGEFPVGGDRLDLVRIWAARPGKRTWSLHVAIYTCTCGEGLHKHLDRFERKGMQFAGKTLLVAFKFK